jgi:peptidylprolyl isomerase
LRKLITAALLVLTATISGCAASPSGLAADYASLPEVCEKFTNGDAVNTINATGAFGTKPTVTFTSPLSANEIETKILIEGNGPAFKGGAQVKFEYIAFNAGNGNEFASSKYDGSDAVVQFFNTGQKLDFCHALSGVKEGSRAAILIPAQMAHDAQGDPSSGISAADNLIFVIDLQRVYLPKAIGDAQPAQTGMPSVVLAPSGQPGVQIPKSQAPSELKIVDLIKGRGETVEIGDKVTLALQRFSLEHRKSQFDSSWNSGAPVQWELTETGFIKGFVEALNGAVVGSQVLAVIPPGDGYGDQASETIPANSTLVFVIDILGVDKAAKN